MNIQIQKQHVEQLESSPLSSRVSLFQLAVPVLPRVLVSDSRFPTPYGWFPFPNLSFRIRVSVSFRIWSFSFWICAFSFRIRVFSFRITVSEAPSSLIILVSESACMLISESVVLVSESALDPKRSKTVTNFSNHLHGVGWGGLLTPWLLTTSNYVSNFSNHLHEVGRGGVGYWLVFY